MNAVLTRADLLKSFEQLKVQFSQALNDAQSKDQAFESLRRTFYDNLSRRLQDAKKRLPEKNPLAQQVSQFMDVLTRTNEEWDKKIAGRDKGVAFRQNFNDSLLVFVYGKVKSGKSSLGNYVAWGNTDPDTVPNLKQSIHEALQPQYFSHDRTNVASGDALKEAENKQEFRVGATEATSSIQGFRLSGLTWVDSPGLHSVNSENGQLARDYVEHADLILYTMKSDAPGRETDLAEIRELFHKDKKTVLLLTGSDTTEEDEDENEQIIQVLVMKDTDTCAKQRSYVADALEKLNLPATNNMEIISFSAHYAQLHEREPELFQDSGMGQFFTVLHDLIHAEGVSMKKRVPMTNFKNFVSDCVRDIAPYRSLLADFEKTVVNLQNKLPKSISAVQSKAKSDITNAVNHEFDLLENHSDSQKKQGIQTAQQKLSKESAKIVQKHLANVFDEIMNDFQKEISDDFNSSDMIKLPDFSVEMQQQEIVSGVSSGTKKRNSGIGSLIGMGIGAFIGGPAGAVAGSFVGGMLGNVLGSDASSITERISLPVGDNFHEIRYVAITAYSEAVSQQISQSADKLLNQVLQEAKKLLQDLNDDVQHMENQLQDLHDDVELVLKQM